MEIYIESLSPWVKIEILFRFYFAKNLDNHCFSLFFFLITLQALLYKCHSSVIDLIFPSKITTFLCLEQRCLDSKESNLGTVLLLSDYE